MANAASLDLEAGSSQYASDTTPNAALNTAGDLTVSCWIKIESNPASGNFYSFGQTRDIVTTRHPWAFLLGNNAGTIELRLGHRNTSDQVETAVVSWTPTLGVWYFVAVTATGTTVKFYVGTQTASPVQQGSNQTLSFTRTTCADPDFYLGTTDGTAEYFDGLIDEFRFYDNDLTDFTYYNSEGTGNETNLQGYWKLNNDYTDSTTNDTDLTASGSPVFSTDVPFTGSSGLQNKIW